MEVLPPRPRPKSRLSLERRRDGGILGPHADLVPGPVAVERARPDSQRADVRPRGPGGQPRRGRQRVLVVSRRNPDALVEHLALPLPPDGVSVRRTDPDQCLPKQAGAGVRTRRHGDLRRRPVLGRHRGLRQGRSPRPPDAHHDRERRARACDAARAAHALVPQHVVVGLRRRTAGVAVRRSTDRRSRRLGDPRAARGRRPGGTVLRERDQHETPLRDGRFAGVPQGRNQRSRRRRRGDGESRTGRNQGRPPLPGRARGRREPGHPHPPDRCIRPGVDSCTDRGAGCRERLRQPCRVAQE